VLCGEPVRCENSQIRSLTSVTRDLTGRRVNAEEARSRFDALHGAGRGVDGAAADSANTLAPSTPTVLGRRVGGRPRVGIDVSMYRCIVGSRFCTGSESNTCSCTFRKYVSKKRGCHGTPPDPTSTWTARHFQHGPLLGRPARLPLRTPRRPARAKIYRRVSAVLGYHVPASSSGSAHACACSCHVSRAWESDCLRCVGPRPLA
jgi:hypothetical protein